MQTIEKIKNRIRKKPYQFFSILTLMIVAIGCGIFINLKNNQVKAYSGTPYSTANGGDPSWIMRNISKTGTSDAIENHFLVDASSEDLNGIGTLSIPYRYSTGQVADLDYSISGQYSFIPKWTPGKSKVYLYDNSDLTTYSEVLNDGTIATTDDTVQTFFSTDTQDESKNQSGKFLKFTNMGMYKGKIIDIVVRPINVSENSSIGVGYGKDGNESGNTDGSFTTGSVQMGSYLTMGRTSGKLNASGAIVTAGTDANYSELDMEFYESISYNDPTVVDMTNQNKVKVRGLFTYGDFDYNESVGLKSSQLNQVFTLKPDERDGTVENGEGPYLDSNQNLFLDYFNRTKNIYTPTSGTSTNTLKYNMDVTKFYAKPDTLVNYTDAQSTNNWDTMYYLLQRFGAYNNAYTQLLYTYGNKDLGATEDGYIYFNRASKTNTEPAIRGNWLSFTYNETDALHFSVNASNSGRNATQSNNDTVDKMLNNELIDPESVDYYLVKNVLGDLGYFEASIPPVIPFWTSSGGAETAVVPYFPSSYATVTGTAIGFISRGMVPVLLPDPVKEATVEDTSGAINWSITQNIPAKFSTTGERKLTITDTLPKYLELDGTVSVKDLTGNESSYWNPAEVTNNTDGTTTITVTPTTSALADDGFYVSSYTISYKTKISDDVKNDETKKAEFMTSYYKDVYNIEVPQGTGQASTILSGTNSLVFLNQARLDLENMDMSARTTYSVPSYETEVADTDTPTDDKYKTAAIVPFAPTITINKTGEVLGSTDIALPDAEFKVYTKDASNSEVYLKNAQGEDAVFTTGTDGKVIVSEFYNDQNVVQNLTPNTTYYIKEVKPPTGYDANTTDAEVTINYIGNYDVSVRDELARSEGDLQVTKQVYNSSGDEIPNTEVTRGEELTYIITARNATQTASRNNAIEVIDTFDTTRVEVILSSMEQSAIGTYSSSSADTYTALGENVYDATSGKMTIDGITLEQDQYIRFRVKVKVKDNAASGTLVNQADASSGTKTSQAKVENTIPPAQREVNVRQVVRNTLLPTIVPVEGYISIENNEATSIKGSGEKLTAIVPSGLETSTVKYRKLILPYSESKNSYFFDLIVPQLYSPLGYSYSTTESGASSTNAVGLDQIFTVPDDNPIYITIYIDALQLGNVPFYNWSDVQNQFGKFK